MILRNRAVLSAVTLCLLLGCRQESGHDLRLVELLEQAHVESPRPGSSTRRSILEAAASSLLDVTFERPEDLEGSWLGRASCQPARHPSSAGRALRCRGERTRLWAVAVEPSTFYRFRRQALVEVRGCGDISLFESSQPYEERLSRPDRRPARSRDLTRVHRFPSPEGSWRRDEVIFFSTPTTRTLLVEFPGSEECDVWIDDLHLDKLGLRRDQELAAIAELTDAGEGDSGLRMRGRALPTAPASSVAPPFDDNYTVREALFAPAPTRFSFGVTIPEDAFLQLSYGLARWSRPGDEATFRVRLETDRGSEELFTETVTLGPEAQGWHWHDARIDLTRHGGRRGRLSLSTESPPGVRGYAVWGNPTLARPRVPADPPNVILLAVDTLRADRLEVYNPHGAPSPHVEGLARDGVLFEQAVSPSNWTLPAFASVLTGAMPSRHRAIEFDSVLSEGFETLPERLRAAGWTTHGLLYQPALQDVGLEQGFDSWFNVPRLLVRAEDNLEKALAWLDRHHDRRFFLFLHFMDPHQPFTQPEGFVPERQKAGLDAFHLGLPLFVYPRFAARVVGARHWERQGCRDCRTDRVLKPEIKELARGLYDGEITYVDDQIGRFLDALRRLGLYEDTLIVFLSDHGEAYWEHGEIFGHGSGCACFYDTVVRVPLILKPPRGERLARGTRVASQVRLFDLMPTVLEMAGLDASDLPGEARSLLPLMRSDPGAEGHRVAISETGDGTLFAVRTGGWKYIRAPLQPGDGSAPVERLFDLRSDPEETTDVAARRPELVRALRAGGLASFARNRGGRFLVIQGNGEPRRMRADLRLHPATAPPVSLFGPEPRDRGSGLLRLESPKTGNPGTDTLFAMLRIPPGTEVRRLEISQANGRDPGAPLELVRVWDDLVVSSDRGGDLTAALQRRGPGAFAFDVRLEEVGESASTTLEGERLEVLKSLGYVE